MSKLIGAMLVLALCFLAATAPPARAFWVTDGTALCTATGDQRYPAIVSDGLGGAIVAWCDLRSGMTDIYVQRVDASGDAEWTVDGVALCTATGYKSSPEIISDGAGGAIITWSDSRSGDYDIYVQRVNALGTVQWTVDGVALCAATGSQEYPAITSDGAGGAIVTWQDYRNGNYDIYARRVEASGLVRWTVNGVALCTATGSQSNPTIASDDAGGAIVTWHDYRSGNYDIYARRVDASGTVQWTVDGVALCTVTGAQEYPTIISDGSGGAIVTWTDLRNEDPDIYAQRVNAAGAVQWKTDGVSFYARTVFQYSLPIVSDGAGGAIVAWQEYYSTDTNIYAQRVSATGSLRWTLGGVALCTATGNQNDPMITSDGAGGAIVTWRDSRSGSSDIYAQRLSANGAVRWTVDGVALCTAAEGQYHQAITSDGAGGAIVTWDDPRSGDYLNFDIYAQSINAWGKPGFLGPVITAVRDVPDDQGGWTRIELKRSSLDDPFEDLNPISIYNVWKRIDSPPFAAAVDGDTADKTDAAIPEIDGLSGWPIKEIGDRYLVSSDDLELVGDIPSGFWELIGSFAACQLDEYLFRAVTDADATASGIPYSVYFVSAHTVTPSIWFASDPDSGYSVDNLAPAIPLGLEGEQCYLPAGLALTWTPNVESDLAEYFVYRGATADFVPELSNRVGSATSASFFDDTWDWSAGYYYKVSASDVHDNESGFALLVPEDITGVETPRTPEVTYLSQNFPNPFNPATKIVFGLSAPGHVSLRIYDAAGRLVRELVNETRAAARYEEAWDGRDSEQRSVASGVYFYRLDAGSFTETKKMILLR